MKTKILFMLLLFFINLCFGQENWGSWTPNKCFKGIYSRVRFDSHNNGYVQVTNKYSKKVAFRASVQDGLGSLDFTLKPSEIQGVGPVGKGINNHLNLIIEKVCFNFLKTGELCVETKNTQEASYAECDNGTPNYKPRDLNKVNSNNSNKNSINSISNDSNSNQQSDIYETVDEIPNFPGGINSFRQKATVNFDTSDIAGSGKAKTEVTFIVEKDGTISNIQAYGSNLQLNNAASKAVSLVKEKWTPAKLNGNIVKYRFRIPFTIDLESEVATNNKPNQQNGTTLRYEGDYKIETIFNSGKVTEVKATNTKTGKLIIHQFYDENEKPKEVITYYENGNKRNHAYFIDGKINSYKENDGHGNFMEKPIPQ